MQAPLKHTTSPLEDSVGSSTQTMSTRFVRMEPISGLQSEERSGLMMRDSKLVLGAAVLLFFKESTFECFRYLNEVRTLPGESIDKFHDEFHEPSCRQAFSFDTDVDVNSVCLGLPTPTANVSCSCYMRTSSLWGLLKTA